MKRLWSGLLLFLCVAVAQVNAQELKATLGKSSVALKGQWQFHTGDDVAWANPALDDSGWEKITADEPWGAQTHVGYTGFAWYRRAVELDGVSGPVSVYVPNVDNAYEIYWNGQQIGGFGKLPPHAKWNPNPVSNVFDLPKTDDGETVKGVLAIRVWRGMLASADTADGGGLNGTPRIGDSKTMKNALALEEDNFERSKLFRIVEAFFLLVVGLAAIGRWAFDRRRRLQLWQGIFLIGLDAGIMSMFPAWNRTVTMAWDQLRVGLFASARDLGIWMLVLVLFGLDKERGWRRVTGVLAAIYLVAQATDVAILPFWDSNWAVLQKIDIVTTVIYSFLPAYLFVLLIAGLRRRRDLLLLPLVLACATLEFFTLMTAALQEGVQFTGIHIEAFLAGAMLHFGPYSLGLNYELQSMVLVVMVLTVYHEQSNERQRQVFMESELKSAREIQSVLVPEETPAVPGYAISSLYWPAGEVGGDMFQVLPGPDGDVLVVLADVSGKGLKAAMTVSLMVGTVRTLATITRRPMEILAGMNERLIGRSSGGFTTCLVLHVTAAGEVTMANAGHLAPFLNGEAMEMEGSLPLGLSHDAEFSESHFSLNEGDEVSLYTDGVLEAQKPDGELFGFERAAELMRTRPTVQEVASAAIAFGQEDDITVVKIARVRADYSKERMSMDLRTLLTAKAVSRRAG